MTKIKSILVFIILIAALSCKTKSAKPINPVLGNYVSTDYDKRNEGYDWVAVKVSETKNGKINISVRSRADKKKPTCTFDTKAIKLNDSIYQSTLKNTAILFQFKGNQLSISTKKPENSGLLNFYCSGGASLQGSYTKINEPLDQNQIDKTQFSSILNLQGVGFNISSIHQNGSNKLTIFTFGLPNEFNETIDLGKQTVMSAEVGDLNSDGSPELFIFTKDKTANNTTHVYAFSVNNKKSMSSVAFMPTEGNKKINDGYQGYDEFAVVETSLVQRFPIFKNKKQTNKIRQIQYKLVDGEASRRFDIKKVTELDLSKQ